MAYAMTLFSYGDADDLRPREGLDAVVSHERQIAIRDALESPLDRLGRRTRNNTKLGPGGERLHVFPLYGGLLSGQGKSEKRAHNKRERTHHGRHTSAVQLRRCARLFQNDDRSYRKTDTHAALQSCRRNSFRSRRNQQPPDAFEQLSGARMTRPRSGQ